MDDSSPTNPGEEQIKVKAITRGSTQLLQPSSPSRLSGVEKTRRLPTLKEKREEALRSGLVKKFREEGYSNPEDLADDALRKLRRRKEARPGDVPEKPKERVPPTFRRGDRSDIFQREYDPEIGFAFDNEDFRKFGVFGAEGMTRMTDLIYGSEQILGASVYKEMDDIRVSMENLLFEGLDTLGVDKSIQESFKEMYANLATTLIAFVKTNLKEGEEDTLINLSAVLSEQMDSLEKLAKIIAGIEGDNPLYNPGVRADYFMSQFGAWMAGNTMKCPVVDVKFDLKESAKNHVVTPLTEYEEMDEFVQQVQRESVETFSPCLRENLNLFDTLPSKNAQFESIEEEEPMVSTSSMKHENQYAHPIQISQSPNPNPKPKFIEPKRGRGKPVVEVRTTKKGKERERESEGLRRRRTIRSFLPKSKQPLDENRRKQSQRLLDLGYDYVITDEDTVLHSQDEQIAFTAMQQSGIGVPASYNLLESYDNQKLEDHFGNPGDVMRMQLEKDIFEESSSLIDPGTSEDEETEADDVMTRRAAEAVTTNSLGKHILSSTETSNMTKEELSGYRKTYFWAVETLGGENQSFAAKIIRGILFNMFTSFTLKEVNMFVANFLQTNDPYFTIVKECTDKLKNDVDGLTAAIISLEKGMNNAMGRFSEAISNGEKIATAYENSIRPSVFVDPKTGLISEDKLLTMQDRIMFTRQAAVQDVASHLRDLANDLGRLPSKREMDESLHDWIETDRVSNIRTWYTSEANLFVNGKQEFGDEVTSYKAKETLPLERGVVKSPGYRIPEYSIKVKAVSEKWKLSWGETERRPVKEYDIVNPDPEILDAIKADTKFKMFMNEPVTPEVHSNALKYMNTGNIEFLHPIKRTEVTLNPNYLKPEEGMKYVAELRENPEATVNKWLKFGYSQDKALSTQRALSNTISYYATGKPMAELFRSLSALPKDVVNTFGAVRDTVANLSSFAQLKALRTSLDQAQLDKIPYKRDATGVMMDVLNNMFLDKARAVGSATLGSVGGKASEIMTRHFLQLVSFSFMSSLTTLSFVGGVPDVYDIFSNTTSVPEVIGEASGPLLHSSWADFIAESIGIQDSYLSSIFSGTSWLVRTCVNLSLTLVTNHVLKVLTTVPYFNVSVTRLPWYGVRKLLWRLADLRLKGHWLAGKGKYADDLRSEMNDQRAQMKFVDEYNVDLMEKQFEKYKDEEIEKAKREGKSEADAIGTANRKAIQRVLKIHAWQRYDDVYGGFMRILGLLVQDFVGPAINQASWYVVKTTVVFNSTSLVAGLVSTVHNSLLVIPGYTGASVVIPQLWAFLVTGLIVYGTIRLGVRAITYVLRGGAYTASRLSDIALLPGVIKRIIVGGWTLFVTLFNQALSEKGIWGVFFRILAGPRQLWSSVKSGTMTLQSRDLCEYRGTKGILSRLKSPWVVVSAVSAAYAILYLSGTLEDINSFLPEAIQPYTRPFFSVGIQKQVNMTNIDRELFARQPGEDDIEYAHRVATVNLEGERQASTLAALEKATSEQYKRSIERLAEPEMLRKEIGPAAGKAVMRQLGKAGLSGTERRIASAKFDKFFENYVFDTEEQTSQVAMDIKFEFDDPIELIDYFVSRTGGSYEQLMQLGILPPDKRSKVEKVTGTIQEAVVSSLVQIGSSVLTDLLEG